MKRLIASLVLSLGLVLANVGSVAAARYWELQMFEPTASTTNRTINIEYKVLSTEEADTFDVELFENNVSKASHQDISSDSGVFSVSIPANGTYTYRIDAENSDDPGNPQSESRTVQVVDGPAPTVTTVSANNANATGGAGGGAGGQGAGGVGGSGAGEVAGETADEGQVGAEAASDENQSGDTLGAAANDAAANIRSRNTAIAIVLAVAAVAAAYYWFIMRPKVD
jgi:VCBS repeat-containing protein